MEPNMPDFLLEKETDKKHLLISVTFFHDLHTVKSFLNIFYIVYVPDDNPCFYLSLTYYL